MRLIALLILPSLAFAAPVPKRLAKPGVELTLSADTPAVLDVTIQYNGTGPLAMPYRVSPAELVEVDLRGEKGERYTIRPHGDDDAETPGTLNIPAGQSHTLSLHTCHSLPEVGGSGQKIIFTARLKHDGRTEESEPLVVNPERG